MNYTYELSIHMNYSYELLNLFYFYLMRALFQKPFLQRTFNLSRKEVKDINTEMKSLFVKPGWNKIVIIKYNNIYRLAHGSSHAPV